MYDYYNLLIKDMNITIKLGKKKDNSEVFPLDVHIII